MKSQRGGDRMKHYFILVVWCVYLVCAGSSGWVPTPTPDMDQLEAEYRAEEYVLSEYHNLTGKTDKEADRLMLQGLMLSQSGRYAESKEYFSKVTTLTPDNPDAWYYLGMSEYRLNQSENAIKAFHKSLEINPDFAYGYYGLSLVYAQQGDIWKQSDALSRALEIEEKAGVESHNQGAPVQTTPAIPLCTATAIIGILCAGIWFENHKR